MECNLLGQQIRTDARTVFVLQGGIPQARLVSTAAAARGITLQPVSENKAKLNNANETPDFGQVLNAIPRNGGQM